MNFRIEYILCLLASLLFSCSPEKKEKEEDSYRNYFDYEYNGRNIHKNNIIDLSDHGINSNHVIVNVKGVKLLLKKKQSYRLEGDLEKSGIIYEVSGDKKFIVGLSNINDYNLDRIKAEDLKHLRGIFFTKTPSPRFMKTFNQLDVSDVFIKTYENIPIHPEARYLNYVAESEEKNPQQLLHTEYLEFLDIHLKPGVQFDCKFLKNLRYLKFLKADNLRNFDELKKLKKLKSIDFGRSFVKDINFCKGMSELTKLTFLKSSLEDASSFKYLKNLKVVNLNDSQVNTIPIIKLPKLEKLNILNTKIPLEQVKKFKELNPKCKVLFNFNETLHDVIKNTDYIRIRTDGIHHKDPEKEQTIAEITDSVKVKEFLDNLNFKHVHHRPINHYGTQTFEFFSKGKHITSLGYIEGFWMNWERSDYNDATLTRDSILYISKLLYRHGIKEHYEKAKVSIKMEDIATQKYENCLNTLPKIMRYHFRKSEKWHEMNDALLFEEDKHKRIKLCLRYLGAHEGSWNHNMPGDRGLLKILENDTRFGCDLGITLDKNQQYSKEDILMIIEENKSDPFIMRGAIRWLLEHYKSKSFSRVQLQEAVHLIMPEALTHPRISTRVKAMHTLKEINRYWAIYHLRKVLNGQYQAKKLTENELEPRWWKGYSSEIELNENYSDFHYAAKYLSEIKDEPSLKEIRWLYALETNLDALNVLKDAIANYSSERNDFFSQR